MPLAFASRSHGTVAFGFFHIETHMLLLDRRLFWAGDFCDVACRLAAGDGAEREDALPGWVVDSLDALGDLHGAIAGVRLHGFLGALYRRWPFPDAPEAFRQQPEGQAPPGDVERELMRWGRVREFAVRAGDDGLELDGVGFSPAQAAALVDYVWRGGMPGWAGGRRPDYVLKMAARLAETRPALLPGLSFDPGRLGYA